MKNVRTYFISSMLMVLFFTVPSTMPMYAIRFLRAHRKIHNGMLPPARFASFSPCGRYLVDNDGKVWGFDGKRGLIVPQGLLYGWGEVVIKPSNQPDIREKHLELLEKMQKNLEGIAKDIDRIKDISYRDPSKR